MSGWTLTQASALDASNEMPLLLVRHGATQPNLDGLRCGGDLDVPLTAIGRQQAFAAACQIHSLGLPIGLIVCSELARTRETARLIAGQLGNPPLLTDSDFAERHLGQWNMRPIGESEAALLAGQVPPGGESNRDFVARIATALVRLMPRLPERPLLVGSRGVARALYELCGQRGHPPLTNGALIQFDLSELTRKETIWSTL